MNKPKTISFCAKCADLFSATLVDEQGNDLVEYQGYVPEFFPGQHWGDYVIMDIELSTGKILNWKKPTAAQLKELYPSKKKDEPLPL